MKVPAQNLFHIVPVFLLLGVVAGILTLVTEQRDMRWGLESEAQGIAIVIAEFTSAPAPGAIAVRAAVDRILALGRARRVEIYEVVEGNARRVLDAGERAGAPSALDGEALGRLARGEEVLRATGTGDRLVAYVPVRRDAGALRAVVGVETSLAPLAARRATLLRRTSIVLLSLAVIGALASLVLSATMSRDIGRLARTAQAFATGDYEAPLAAGRIREVAEVGATLGIMGSVLKDAAQQSTHAMLQFQRVRHDAPVAERFAERFLRRVEGEGGGLRVAIDRAGAAPHGDFCFFRADGGRYRACLGRLDLPPSFEALLAASSCEALLQDGLDRRAAVADVLERAGTLFPMHSCLLLEWSDGGPIAVNRLAGGRPAVRTEQRPEPGRTAFLSTLDAGAHLAAASYVESHSFERAARAVEELRRFFEDGTPGGVIVLQVASS